MKVKSATPFYFCESCNQRHPAELPKMQQHIQELRAKGLRPTMHKQGRANVLSITKK
jgi:hypothetical protein